MRAFCPDLLDESAIYHHLDVRDDYYLVYGNIKHICKNYKIVDSGNSIPAHPFEDSLGSIETASRLHIGYFEALRLIMFFILLPVAFTLIIGIVSNSFLCIIIFKHRKTPPAYIQTVFIICMDQNTKKVFLKWLSTMFICM